MRAKIRAAVDSLFKQGLPYVMLSNLLQQGLAFLAVLCVAKILSPSDFALVRIALAYIAIATVLAAGGVTTPILRYCADTALPHPERQWLLGVGILRVLAISVVVTLGALGLVLAWPMESLKSSVFSVYALQLPGLAIASLLLVYLQAIQKFKILAYYQVAIRVITMALSVLAAYFYGLTGFLGATLISAYLVCVPLLVLSNPRFRVTVPLSIPADFSKLAYYSVFGTAVTALGQYADVIMLDLVGIEKERIATYSLATIFYFAALAVGGAVQSVATPMFTELIRKPVELMKRLRRWTMLLSIAAVPVSIALVLVAKVVESWFLGSNYSGLSNILLILMIKFLLWSTFAVGGAALVGVGAIKQGAWIAVLTTMLSVVVGFPLCQHFGIYGAAWSQVLVSAVSAVLILSVLRHEIRYLNRSAHAGQFA